jgi:acyl-coenzyme A synthetase/AMP-(fatty) acid ligase
MTMLPDNVGHLFDVPLALIPEQPAVLQGDIVVTFATLDERCNRLGNALRELGVEAGHRVALMFSNDFRFLESLFAPMRLGAVPVPLNTRMGDAALQYVIEDAEAAVMIVNRAMAERARDLAARIPSLTHLIIDDPRADGAIPYEPLLAASSAVLPRRTTQADEICMQPYTSGSTGRPKGVLLDHGGQIWNADVLRKAILCDHRERGLVAAELYQGLGIPEVGALLSCNRDFSLIEGFNEDITLTRTQTIMGGASHCDFRYVAKPSRHGPPTAANPSSARED